MKTFLNIFLLAAILGIAYFTRPSEAQLQAVLAAPEAAPASSTLPDPHTPLADYVYKDRFLWADIQKDGKTLYTGAFGHWFEWGHLHEAPAEKANVKFPV